MSAMFYGVGVGPGDRELLTLKAVRLLKECDIVAVPVTRKGKESLALDIAGEYAEGKEILQLEFPMSSNQEKLNLSWDTAAENIKNEIKNGKKIVFLTLGDPMLYSTYIYLYMRIKDMGIPCETVPGVNSFSLAAAVSGVPLCFGEEKMAVIPSAFDCRDLDKILNEFDSIVLMKVYKNFDRVFDIISNAGLLEKAVLVTRAGLDEEEIHKNITKLKGTEINYLSLIIINKNWVV